MPLELLFRLKEINPPPTQMNLYYNVPRTAKSAGVKGTRIVIDEKKYFVKC